MPEPEPLTSLTSLAENLDLLIDFSDSVWAFGLIDRQHGKHFLLTFQGLTTPGLTTPGLTTQGLTTQGLTTQGPTTQGPTQQEGLTQQEYANVAFRGLT